MAQDGREKPLQKISEAFKDLATTINSQHSDLEIAPFSHACSLVSPLFSCLGIAFKFAEMDYVAKVGEFSLSLLTFPPFGTLVIEGFLISFKIAEPWKWMMTIWT